MSMLPAFFALLFSIPLTASAAVDWQKGPSASWACGGVGAEERHALDGLRPRANLEVLIVTAKRGGYLAGAHLAIRPESAAAPVVQALAEGPICLVQAAPGTYRIEARYEGVVRSAKATVVAGGKAARVVLAFPDEPWDGIRATEEEKRQAREP